ncbi:MAG: AI-2E family transporter [Thermoleophilia bacterium]|nr:AI-2E family transporter [Thermoleophilia bacterium]
MRISIPRWVQMVGLPVIIILVWLTASMLTTVIFMFAAAAVIALILDPLVRQLERLKIPRPLGVVVVYLTMLAIIVTFFILIIPPGISQLLELVDDLPQYTESIRDQFERWVATLERLNLPIDVSDEVDRIIDRVQNAIIDVGTLLVQYSINAVSLIAQGILIFVISIYMLLDSRRIGRTVRRFFPQDQQADADDFVNRTRGSVSHWVRGQVVLSILVGVSSGLGIWLLAVTGIWPEGGQYAIFFGVWAGLTEIIPFIGPFLGAAPPVTIALFSSPWAALAVVGVYLVIQQVEGHILVPKIMGQVMGVHPLVVIFATLAGAELRGVAGMLVVLPLVALGREVVVFFKPRITLEKPAERDELRFPEVPPEISGTRE